ncbi:MAG: hypothetical protein U0U70_16785 [Chitinophagaceae bacterium]
MGNNKSDKNRREFFFSLFEREKEKVKMLTADGRLVEVDKSVYDRAVSRLKANNKDIYLWMENPSKKDNNS